MVKRKDGSSREQKAARTMAVIVVTFVVCWLPFFTMYVTLPFCSSCGPPPALVRLTFLTFLLSESNWGLLWPATELIIADWMLLLSRSRCSSLGWVTSTPPWTPSSTQFSIHTSDRPLEIYCPVGSREVSLSVKEMRNVNCYCDISKYSSQIKIQVKHIENVIHYLTIVQKWSSL